MLHMPQMLQMRDMLQMLQMRDMLHMLHIPDMLGMHHLRGMPRTLHIQLSACVLAAALIRSLSRHMTAIGPCLRRQCWIQRSGRCQRSVGVRVAWH